MADTQRINARASRKIEVTVISCIVLLGFLLLLFWNMMFVAIPPGHVGALYSLLFGGTVEGKVYREGIAIKSPWDRLYIFDARVQSLSMTVEAETFDGLPIKFDATIIFHMDATKTDKLLKLIGPDYVQRFVMPLASDAIRVVTGVSDSNRMYTVEQSLLRKDVINLMQARSKQTLYGLVVVDDILIRRIKLPDELVSAIENKLTQEQIAASYEFRIAAQKSEADRMRIEAIGLQNYYSIVRSALSKEVLIWRGIEATTKLADSPNTKIVVIGNGAGQLPIILGGDIDKVPSAAEVPPAPSAPLSSTLSSGNHARPVDPHDLPDWEKFKPLFGPVFLPTDPEKNEPIRPNADSAPDPHTD